MMQWTKQLKPYALFGALVIAIGAVPLSATHAQSAPTTITVALPSFTSDYANSGAGKALIQQFEDAHPGVQVQVVSKDAQVPPAAAGLDNYFKGLQDYVSSADVLYTSDVTPESTRAGYFLDLMPLITTDSSVNVADFYPAAWKAFQWDNGYWALPTNADAIALMYKPSAFDAAGLNYPTASWTVDDLVNAVQKLTQKNADGSIAVNGLTVLGRSSLQALLQSLIASSLVDNTASPNMPQLDTPESEKVLDALNQINNQANGGGTFSSRNSPPLSVAPLELAGAPNASGEKLAAVALPGGHFGLTVNGFAVSAGTQHPNEAYALAVFLTQHPEFTVGLSSSPARKSVAANASNTPSQSSTGSGPSGGGIALRGPQIPAELKPLLDQALNSGLTLADMPYTDYLVMALKNMQANNLTANAALTAIEAQAIKDQQTAIAAKGKTPIVVATPIPIAVAPGKITLKFGLTSNIRPTPNQDTWQQLASDFAKNDPVVGRVDVQVSSTQDLTQNADSYDCFVLPFNAVPGANLSNLLNFDPYLESDTNFDKTDVVGNLLAQLQQDNKTWALPLMILPSMMSYDPQQFSQAGVPAPANSWNFSDFVNALKALKDRSTQPPFDASSPGGTYLLELMAAAGGLPIDYRTNPPTANFTDPATVAAIQQVLDLAKNGYIKYSAIGGTGGFMIISIKGGSSGGPAITTQDLSLPRLPNNPNGTPNAPSPNQLVAFPSGSQYNAVSYSLTTGYISAKAQNPDACYRWLSMIAQHSELFSAMPARRSLLNSPNLAATQGADRVNLYKQMDTLLGSPNTITFPSLFQGGAAPTGFILEHWLYTAFDNYVLHNADLNTELKNAQDLAQGFQQCTASIPPYDPASAQTASQYKQQYLACAVKVDPSLKNLAGG
ncbi:MAG: ABC transporter substrate-binding protein [Aggregatilineales bacterium]